MPWRADGAERVSAHRTPYCSPGGASWGPATVTDAIVRPPGGTSEVTGSTDVHVDNSFGVCSAAPTNLPWLIAAASGYKRTCTVEAVVFEISIRRLITVPGCRWSTM